MNDKDLDTLLNRAVPDDSGEPPRKAMWQHISRHSAAPQQSVWPRFRTLVPAGAMGITALFLALYLLKPGSSPAPIPDASQAAARIDELRNVAPGVYEQNKAVLDDLSRAIEDIQSELETLPDDALLLSRLAYYSNWQDDVIADLFRISQGDNDA